MPFNNCLVLKHYSVDSRLMDTPGQETVEKLKLQNYTIIDQEQCFSVDPDRGQPQETWIIDQDPSTTTQTETETGTTTMYSLKVCSPYLRESGLCRPKQDLTPAVLSWDTHVKSRDQISGEPSAD